MKKSWGDSLEGEAASDDITGSAMLKVLKVPTAPELHTRFDDREASNRCPRVFEVSEIEM